MMSFFVITPSSNVEQKEQQRCSIEAAPSEL